MKRTDLIEGVAYAVYSRPVTRSRVRYGNATKAIYRGEGTRVVDEWIQTTSEGNLVNREQKQSGLIFDLDKPYTRKSQTHRPVGYSDAARIKATRLNREIEVPVTFWVLKSGACVLSTWEEHEARLAADAAAKVRVREQALARQEEILNEAPSKRTALDTFLDLLESKGCTLTAGDKWGNPTAVNLDSLTRGCFALKEGRPIEKILASSEGGTVEILLGWESLGADGWALRSARVQGDVAAFLALVPEEVAA